MIHSDRLIRNEAANDSNDPNCLLIFELNTPTHKSHLEYHSNSCQSTQLNSTPIHFTHLSNDALVGGVSEQEELSDSDWEHKRDETIGIFSFVVGH